MTGGEGEEDDLGLTVPPTPKLEDSVAQEEQEVRKAAQNLKDVIKLRRQSLIKGKESLESQRAKFI